MTEELRPLVLGLIKNGNETAIEATRGHLNTAQDTLQFVNDRFASDDFPGNAHDDFGSFDDGGSLF